MAENGSSGWEFAAGFFIGGVVGGLIGAAAALLLAPQPGEETRTLLREKGIELRERASDLSGDARKRAEEATAGVRDRSASLRETVRLAVDERLAQVKDAVETGKQAAAKKQEELMQSLHAEPPADA